MLDDLIDEIEARMKARDLSDEYLKEHDCSTREDIGIGEYAYGITMIPCEWVYPFLLDLQSKNNLISKQQTKTKNLNELLELTRCDLQNSYSIETGLKKELEKKDKVIDLMAKEMLKDDLEYEDICKYCEHNNEDCHGDYCAEARIKYFYKQAEDK